MACGSSCGCDPCKGKEEARERAMAYKAQKTTNKND